MLFQSLFKALKLPSRYVRPHELFLPKYGNGLSSYPSFEHFWRIWQNLTY